MTRKARGLNDISLCRREGRDFSVMLGNRLRNLGELMRLPRLDKSGRGNDKTPGYGHSYELGDNGEEALPVGPRYGYILGSSRPVIIDNNIVLWR